MIAQLGTGAWDDWRGSYEFLKGQVRLPRFTVEWKGSLVGPLAALGMGPAFEHSIADFSALAVGDRAFAIDDVAHSVFVAVDEEGTEAGAATAIGATIESYQPPFQFIADRPFLWAIVDDETGSILFLGAVYDP